jgi:hypothetical protein
MSETLDTTTTTTAKRPGFLTVLCILTFIGSGLGLLGAIFGLIGASFIGMFTPQGTMIVQIIGLLASALCLFGAIKMWGLYKQGFMLYLVGAILGIVGPIISAVTMKSYLEQTMASMPEMQGVDTNLVGDAALSLATAAAWTAVIMAVIFNTLFIILYAVNRKHLVK